MHLIEVSIVAGAVKTKEPDSSGDWGVRASPVLQVSYPPFTMVGCSYPVLQYWGTLEDNLRRCSSTSASCCQGTWIGCIFEAKTNIGKNNIHKHQMNIELSARWRLQPTHGSLLVKRLKFSPWEFVHSSKKPYFGSLFIKRLKFGFWEFVHSTAGQLKQILFLVFFYID